MTTDLIASAGDVFFIPINEKNAIGFIESQFHGEIYIAVYDVLVDDFEEASRVILDEDPLFLCLTSEGFIYHQRWTIVGSMKEHLGKIPRPTFKVGSEGKTYVRSLYNERSRLATESEIENLRFRGTVTSKVVDMAIKAHFGIGGAWPYFKNLRADYAIETEGLV